MAGIYGEEYDLIMEAFRLGERYEQLSRILDGIIASKGVMGDWGEEWETAHRELAEVRERLARLAMGEPAVPFGG